MESIQDTNGGSDAGNGGGASSPACAPGLVTVPPLADPHATVPPVAVAAGAAAPPGTTQRIGDYEILAPIASGGMGVVYKARQLGLDRIVALKMMLRADTASADDIRRFHAEAEAAAQLDHPGIVPIFDVGEADGRHYFSMAFVEGGSLLKLLADGPMEPRAAAGLLNAVSSAVAYGHDRGIVHRDLKPANILLGADGTPKVTDFGLAKRVEAAGDLTHTGQILGTPSYMPPEQARGDLSAIGPLSDVYAIGAVLYHAVTGRPPFMAATVMATLKQVLEADPVSPMQLNPQVDRDLETIALKCLEKEPHRRYGSAAELAADLGRFIAGEPIIARRSSAWERAYKWSRRRPAAAMLAAVSLVAVVSMAVGGLFYAQAAEQRAKLAQREARDRARQLEDRDALDATRRALQAAVRRSSQLLDAGSLQEAEVAVEQALAKAGDTPALAEERREIEALKADLAGRLAADRDRAAARQRLTDFDGHRDTAMFYGLQSFGLDPVKNQQTAASEARAALAAWGIDPAATAHASAPIDWQSSAFAHYDEAERSRIRSRCYELLLVFADATLRSEGAASSRKEIDAAIAAVDRAVSVIGHETPATRLERAECLDRRGDGAGAARERSLATRQGGADTAADSFLVGKLLLRPDASATDEDLKRAKTAFEQTLLLEPDHFWAQYCLGMQGLRQSRPDMADVYFTSCVARRPDFAWSYILRGAARTSLGEFDLAAADFDHAVALEPEREARHVALVNRAVLEFTRNRPDEARRLLAEAIDLEPRGYQAIVSLATVESRQGRHDEALALLDQAVELEPNSPVVHRQRGRLHAERRDSAAAERDLRAAARLEGTNPEARADDLALLGQMLFRQQKYDEALAIWDESLSIDPDEPQSHLWRAALLVDRGRFEEALPSFDAFLKRGRPNVEFYLTRGMCRASMGSFAAAIDDYSRAIEIEPSAAALCQRGWLYALRGNPAFGLQDFEKAITRDPSHADAHCGRGLALAYVGRHADAALAAERAMELAEPSFVNTYKVATVFAAAAPRVVLSAEEKKKQGPTPGQLRVAYIERAAELLDRALDNEADHLHDDLWAAHVETDGHFQPLLLEPEFKKLKRAVLDRAADPQAAVSENPSAVAGAAAAGDAP